VENVNDVGGKVLIFCESGNNRSPVLVAAYLMIIYGVSAFSAIHVIQSQRFCITMSDDLKNVLLDLQHILEAQRTVSATNASSADTLGLPGQGSHSSMCTKRNLDDMDTSDEEMEADSPEDEACSIREGVAPFADSTR
jgi:serine/threonine/tyrosine-interacting protein